MNAEWADRLDAWIAAGRTKDQLELIDDALVNARDLALAGRWLHSLVDLDDPWKPDADADAALADFTYALRELTGALNALNNALNRKD